MIKNYIPENIAFLVKKLTLSQDEFGSTFEVGRGLISNYINGKALPKIETIQRICLHFEISIDDFVNRDLSQISKNAPKPTSFVNDVVEPYIISPKYVELLERSIEDKDRIIRSLEDQLGLEQPKGSNAS